MSNITLIDVYEALRQTFSPEDAKTIVGYLEGLSSSKAPVKETKQFIRSDNALQCATCEELRTTLHTILGRLPQARVQEYEELRTTHHIKYEKAQAEIRKAKRSTMWAMVVGMILSWAPLLYLICKMK